MVKSREDKIEYPLMINRDECNELIAYLQPYPRSHHMANVARKLLSLQIKIAGDSRE